MVSKRKQTIKNFFFLNKDSYFWKYNLYNPEVVSTVVSIFKEF